MAYVNTHSHVDLYTFSKTKDITQKEGIFNTRLHVLTIVTLKPNEKL